MIDTTEQYDLVRTPCPECVSQEETPFQEFLKSHAWDIYGWSGSLCVLTAYTVTSLEIEEWRESYAVDLLDLLNLYGSLAIGSLCYRAKIWPAFSLEVAWFGIAGYSLLCEI
jgi:hypothetical protein